METALHLQPRPQKPLVLLNYALTPQTQSQLMQAVKHSHKDVSLTEQDVLRKQHAKQQP